MPAVSIFLRLGWGRDVFFLVKDRPGNKYHAKALVFTLEEVRDGRPHRIGEAKLNLAALPMAHRLSSENISMRRAPAAGDCLPFGQAALRYLAFGPCIGVVSLVGRPAGDRASAVIEVPDVEKLTERLQAAEAKLREAEAKHLK